MFFLDLFEERPLIFGSRFIFSIRFACHLIELLIVLGWPAKLVECFDSINHIHLTRFWLNHKMGQQLIGTLSTPEFFCGWHNSTILINTYWSSQFRSIGIGSQLSSLSQYLLPFSFTVLLSCKFCTIGVGLKLKFCSLYCFEKRFLIVPITHKCSVVFQTCSHWNSS